MHGNGQHVSLAVPQKNGASGLPVGENNGHASVLSGNGHGDGTGLVKVKPDKRGMVRRRRKVFDYDRFYTSVAMELSSATYEGIILRTNGKQLDSNGHACWEQMALSLTG